MHIDNVRNVRNVIKLTKLWILRHSLDWQTNSNNPIEIPKKTRRAIEQEAKCSFDALKNGDWKSIVW
ncbi:MAG: hypothetical protein DRR16_22825 [Candidatus Parabeggiatoa sp. nov. 3]|nr:MAG: hypothetical protein DRQ99_22205 [Gammaproteobacteria bacterium]RKZ81016.1 MAG: hypothetical protein DRR16_22825 [Gammaproteobacteria bacterium]